MLKEPFDEVAITAGPVMRDRIKSRPHGELAHTTP